MELVVGRVVKAHGLSGELVLVGAVEVDKALSKFFRRGLTNTAPTINGLPIVAQSLVAILLRGDHRSAECCNSSGSQHTHRSSKCTNFSGRKQIANT